MMVRPSFRESGGLIFIGKETGRIMTLKEMAVEYRESARKIEERIRQLEAQKKASEDIREIRQLESRIRALTPMLRETRELATLTERYHDRGHHINERYKI